MELFKHNQEAYEKVMEAFKTKQRAAIVHATGTGKSYVIAAVAEHFERVLIIAPNNFVLNETRKVCKNGVEFRTYASVMYNEGDSNKYDLIVFDEFHRSGAERWGEGAERLIKANPNAKLFGTSANNIRYLDSMRNMAEEMFDGNIVSQLTLSDAWRLGIIRVPIYVRGIYDIEDTIEKAESNINLNESYLRKKNKEKATKIIGRIRKCWEDSRGVPAIIQKYFDPNIKRVIVFCSKVENAEKARYMLGSWFASAGYKRIMFYNIDYTNPHVDRDMKHFQEDNYDGLKVAISVNMLNEGVHIPFVDCIIMLRSTISRIIFEQQIGRCLTVNRTDVTPLILDLADNVRNLDIQDVDFSSYTGNRKSKKIKKVHLAEYSFKVYDEVEDIRKAILEIDSLVCSTPDNAWNRLFPELTAFIDINGRFPTKAENSNIYNFLRYYQTENAKIVYPERVKKLEDLGMVYTLGTGNSPQSWEERYEELKTFYNTNGRIPIVTDAKKGIDPTNLYGWIRRQRDMRNVPSDFREKLAVFGITIDRKIHTWDENYEELKKYVESHYGQLPSQETRLGSWMKHQRKKFTKDSEEGKLLDALGVYNFKNEWNWERAKLATEDFISKNGRTPTMADNRTLYIYISNINSDVKNGNVVENVEEKTYYCNKWFKEKPSFFDVNFNNKFERLKEFYEKNGRLPRSSKYAGETSLYRFFMVHMKTRDDLRAFVERAGYIKFKSKGKCSEEKFHEQFEEQYEKLKSYCEKNNQLPPIGNPLRNWYQKIRNHKFSNEYEYNLIFELGEKYNTYESKRELRYEELEDVLRSKGSIPTGDYWNSWLRTEYNRDSVMLNNLLVKYGCVYSPKNTIIWETGIQLVKEFIKQNNRLPVPEDGKVGTWLETQRKLIMQNRYPKTTEEKKKILEELGVSCENKKISEWRSKAMAYAEHLENSTELDSKGQIYNWANRTKLKIDRGEAKDWMVKILNELHLIDDDGKFIYEKRFRTWDEAYDELCTFGVVDANVCGDKNYYWAMNQKSRRLTKDKADKLRAFGLDSELWER